MRQGSLGSRNRADSIGLVGSCDQLSSLTPGKYTATLSESFVVAEPVTFEVKVGDTTTVHVVVARR